MVLKSKENNIGAWSFLIGVVLATIIGVFTTLIPIPSLTLINPPTKIPNKTNRA